MITIHQNAKNVTLDFRLLFIPHWGNPLVTVAVRQTISTRLKKYKKKI